MPNELGGIKLFMVQDLSRLLSLTPQTVRKYLKDGKIKAKKVGIRYMVTEENLKNFLNGITDKD